MKIRQMLITATRKTSLASGLIIAIALFAAELDAGSLFADPTRSNPTRRNLQNLDPTRPT
jgi:hypothetical protein